MLGKASKYALKAMIYLAKHSSEEEKRGIKELAEELDIPKHFLAKIMQELSRKRLVSSTKGPSGGFYLTKKHQKLSLMDIIKVTEGKEVFTNCIIGLEECSNTDPCPIHDIIYGYKKSLLSALSETKLILVSEQLEKKLKIK
jgi:Rrf2 family protein